MASSPPHVRAVAKKWRDPAPNFGSVVNVVCDAPTAISIRVNFAPNGGTQPASR
jgi:hypothetical protein